jgi:hypothetical protein
LDDAGPLAAGRAEAGVVCVRKLRHKN